MGLQVKETFSDRFKNTHTLFASTFSGFQEVSQAVAGLKVKVNQALANAKIDNLREFHPRELQNIANTINMQANVLLDKKIHLSEVINSVKVAVAFTTRNPISQYDIQTIDSLGIYDGLGGQIDQMQKQLPLFKKQLLNDLSKLMDEEKIMHKEIKDLSAGMKNLQNYIENRNWFSSFIHAAFDSSPIESKKIEQALFPEKPTQLTGEQYNLPSLSSVNTNSGIDDGYETTDTDDGDESNEETGDVTEIATTQNNPVSYSVADVIAQQKQMQKDLEKILAATRPTPSVAEETTAESLAPATQDLIDIEEDSDTDSSEEEPSLEDQTRAEQIFQELQNANLVEDSSDDEEDIPAAIYPKAPQRRSSAKENSSEETPALRRSSRLAKKASENESSYADLQKQLDAINQEFSAITSDEDSDDDTPLSILAAKFKEKKAEIQPMKVAENSPYAEPVRLLNEIIAEKEAPVAKATKTKKQTAEQPLRRSARLNKSTAVQEETPIATAPKIKAVKVKKAAVLDQPSRRSTRSQTPVASAEEKEAAIDQPLKRSTRRKPSISVAHVEENTVAVDQPLRRSTRAKTPVAEEKAAAVDQPLRRSTRRKPSVSVAPVEEVAPVVKAKETEPAKKPARKSTRLKASLAPVVKKVKEVKAPKVPETSDNVRRSSRERKTVSRFGFDA